MAVDSEVNGASHVKEAFIALETQIHSLLLQQFPHSVCLFAMFVCVCAVVIHFSEE